MLHYTHLSMFVYHLKPSTNNGIQYCKYCTVCSGNNVSRQDRKLKVAANVNPFLFYYHSRMPPAKVL